MSTLGRLEKITNLRQVWPGEASHFTPWLARPENIAALADALGFGPDGFEVEAVEFSVGAFRADILARDLTSPEGDRVLIENQFGRSDHDHLGKLITYASGLKARTVILIGEEIREEHRSAMDWLNQISDDQHQFFAVSLELWRIGESLPAPRFNVVVKPNDWERLVNSTATLAVDGMTELKQLYVRYWAALGDHFRATNSKLRARKPQGQQWSGFSIGRSGIELNAFINTNAQWIRAELTLNGDSGKAWFARLLPAQMQIAQELPFAVEWEEMPDRKQSRISVTLPGTSPVDEADWPRQHAWLLSRLTELDRVFRHRISAIDHDAGMLP